MPTAVDFLKANMTRIQAILAVVPLKKNKKPGASFVLNYLFRAFEAYLANKALPSA